MSGEFIKAVEKEFLTNLDAARRRLFRGIYLDGKPNRTPEEDAELETLREWVSEDDE